MRLKQTVCLIATISLFQSASYAGAAFPADSVSQTNSLVVGPEELGILLTPSELFKIDLDRKLEKKAAEEDMIKDYLTLRTVQQLLHKTETFMSPEEKSLSVLNQLQHQYEMAKDWKSLALVLNTYAVYYGKEGDLEKSLKFFKESFQAEERLKDRSSAAQTSETIAAISKFLQKYDDAVFYYEQNAQINMAQRKANQIAEAYLKIADIKAVQKKYAEAERYVLRKAFPIFQRMGNKNGRLSCFESLAEIYHQQNRLSEAKWFYLQASTLADKLHNLPAQVTSLMKVARIKNEAGETEMALKDYTTAELLARQHSFKVQLVEIKGDVAEIYRKKGNYNAAGIALDEYNQLKSSLLNGSM